MDKLRCDKKVILCTNPDPIQASHSLQKHHLSIWKMVLKVEDKNSGWKHPFNFEKQHTTLFIWPNYRYQARYLRLILDPRLTLDPYTCHNKYWQEVTIRPLDNRSKLSLTNKVTICNTIIKTVRSHGLVLRSSTKPSNFYKIQFLQSIILKKITIAPYYVSNTIKNVRMNLAFWDKLMSQLIQLG